MTNVSRKTHQRNLNASLEHTLCLSCNLYTKMSFYVHIIRMGRFRVGLVVVWGACVLHAIKCVSNAHENCV